MLDVQSYLNNQHLRKLFSKTKVLRTLNAKLSPTIPNHIINYCQIANFEDREIIIGCGSASLMLEAKRYETQFLMLAQSTLPQCRTIRWKIMPELLPQQKTHKRKPQISNQSRQIIELTAKHIKNPALKDALTRLATID